jgi:hypothetical protein
MKKQELKLSLDCNFFSIGQAMGIEKSCNDHRQRLKNKSIAHR